MRFSKIINSYKALLDDQMLEESRLTSEFTIGFELEGICDNDTDPELYSQGSMPPYHSGKSPSGGARKLKSALDKLLGLGSSYVSDYTGIPMAYLGEIFYGSSSSNDSAVEVTWDAPYGKEGHYYLHYTYYRAGLYWTKEPIQSLSDIDENGKQIASFTDNTGNTELNISEVKSKEYNIPKGVIKVRGSKIERDGSLHPSSEDSSHAWTFEYGSPIIRFNPTNMNKILKFLKQLKTLGVKTNNSCGFHVHIAFDNMTRDDAKWLLFSIANDESLLNEVTILQTDSHTPIKFFTDETTPTHYASKEWFDALKAHGNLTNWSFSKNTSDKFLTMRMHPQGTLEWRGPRNFINDGQNEQLIQEFIKKLWRLVLKFSQIVDLKEYNGYKKSEVLEKMKVVGEFKTTDVRKQESKGDLYQKILLNPIMFATLKPEYLESILSKHAGEVLEYNNYSSELKARLLNIWKKIPTKNKDIIIKYDLSNSYGFNFVYNILSNGLTLENWEMDSVTTNSVLKAIIEQSDSIPSSKITDILKTFINHMTITDARLINKALNRLKPIYIGDIIKSIDPRLISFDFIKEIAMSNHKSILLNLDNIPVKIQRMLIRKSPYNIQYINNPDQSVINELRKKYGNDIDEYILGVL